MTSNESKQKADLIWSKLFAKHDEPRTKEDELKIIEGVVIQIAQENREVGRRQILNHFEVEVKSLRD